MAIKNTGTYLKLFGCELCKKIEHCATGEVLRDKERNTHYVCRDCYLKFSGVWPKIDRQD